MITIRNITKIYKMGSYTLEVLKGIDLTIDDGDFVAIMGPSGSGKSTLMNILGLLDVPSSGSYQFNRVEVAQMNEDELAILRRKEIGFIFQQFNLLPRMSAAENVALPLLYSKLSKGLGRAEELLATVGLSDRRAHRPNELSGGQQQRVAIARSLVNRPQMILADEPTGNLDSHSEKEIMKILRDLNESGITIVIVTHEEEIGHQANRLIRMRDGLIVTDERIRDNKILSNTADKLKDHQKPQLELNSSFDFLDYFEQGFKTLMANKVRTGLSMLGILIGVAAVVAMLALGRGAQNAIEEQLSSLGSNLLTIRSGSVRIAGVTQESGAANRLSFDDIGILKSRINSLKNVSGQVNGRVQVTARSKNWNTQVQGASASWAEMHNSVPPIGRFFNEDENISRQRLAVVGATIVRELFGGEMPIGEMIKINKVNFQIIGVLPEKGATGWRDQDDVILVPLATAMHRLLGRDNLDMIEAEVDRPENIDTTQSSISNVLSNQHKIPMSQQDDAFQIRNMADIQSALQQSSQTMSLLLSTIAAISLLVGGIGIMNIMLVSVTERTREIGLRKALGARSQDILSQFLSESVVVSVVGGSFGIFLGWLITTILSALTGWATAVSISSVMLSFIFSAMIGIIFGVYPARKASRLHPIDALRSE